MTQVGESGFAATQSLQVNAERYADFVGLSAPHYVSQDGYPIEAHIDNLYSSNAFEKRIFCFACPPEEYFSDVVDPRFYQRVYKELVVALERCHTSESYAALQQLREFNEIRDVMDIIKHLLHKA